MIGERRGTGNGPTVVLAGHLDTVFPEGTEVAVKREGSRYARPRDRGRLPRPRHRAGGRAGDGDEPHPADRARSCSWPTWGRRVRATCAARARSSAPRRRRSTTSSRWTAPASDSPPARSAATASRSSTRDPAGTATAPSGCRVPSTPWGARSRRSPTSRCRVPPRPRSTWASSSGGTSVNTISPLGAMEVDMRSESPASLAELEAKFTGGGAGGARRGECALAAVIGEDHGEADGHGHPAGSSRERHVADRPDGAGGGTGAGLRGARRGASSTDSNIPMSLGIPAVTIDGGGIGRGRPLARRVVRRRPRRLEGAAVGAAAGDDAGGPQRRSWAG